MTEEADGATTVDCSNRLAASIPAGLLSDRTTTLVLAFNIFFDIPTLQLASAPNLHVLDLKTNSLSVIGNDSFSTATRLRQLNLDANVFLHTIEVNAFQHLRQLIKLSLMLTAITRISPSHFVPLTSLESLNFGFNNVSDPHKDLFAPLLSIRDISVGSCGEISLAIGTQSFGISALPAVARLYVQMHHD